MHAILIPTKFEAEVLLKRMQDPVHYQLDNVDCYLGEINEITTTIAIIGMGPPNVGPRTAKFIQKTGPSQIILCGFAGAINPELKRGDVIIDKSMNRILPVDKIVSSSKEKQDLHLQTGRDAVDMETKYVTSNAEDYSIPLSVLRIISDTAEEDVPTDLLEHGYNQEAGKYTHFKMAWFLLTNPKQISRLKKFLEPLKPLREKLADEVTQLLESQTDKSKKKRSDAVHITIE